MTPGMEATQAAALHAEIRDFLEHSDTRLQEICAAHRTTIRTWFAGIGPYERFMEEIEYYRFEEARRIFLSEVRL